MKSKFKYHITNDTLYIALNKETTKPYFYDWSDDKVIVLFETIASFSFENSQNSMYCKQLSNLKIRGKGINSSRIHLVKVDSLDIKVTDKTKLKGIKSKASHLKIRAEGKSDVSMHIFTASENDIKFTEEATVKIK